MRTHGTQTSGGRSLGDDFLEVVHVREAGRARPDHLRAAQVRAERDKIRPDELALDRHHVAEQPDVEPQVVGQTAQHRHRDVGVRVDEAGHHYAAGTVDRLLGLVIRFDVTDG